MRPIYIKDTAQTPAIFMDMDSGRLLITGLSVMCDPKATYLQLMEKVRDYALNPSEETKVSILLKETNTGSMLFLLEILKLLKQNRKGHILTIDWLYDVDDQHLFENIKMIEDILKTDINKVAYVHNYWPKNVDPLATLDAYEALLCD